MTSDDASSCKHGRSSLCAACRLRAGMIAHGPYGQQRPADHAMNAPAQDKRLGRAEHNLNCCTCMAGCADPRDVGVAAHVRTKIRTMAGDLFAISRHTGDCIVNALQDRFFSDSDAVLKRILDLAALRYLRDGSTTVTSEDVALALRSLASPATGLSCCDRCRWEVPVSKL